MALSVFDNKTKKPDDSELSAVLGDTYKLWQDIKKFVIHQYPEATEEWNYSGKNYGWGFRLRDNKRVIIYLTPCNGFFKFALVFGKNATDEALQSEISDDLKSTIKASKVYAEGRGIRIDVKNKNIINGIKKMIKIKLLN
jgi:hypothetical protein